MGVSSYRQLKVWSLGIELAVEAYKVTSCFPKYERFGLASQIQRSAAAIPANIAEGQGRFSTREFLRYIAIAYGSLAELETHIEVATRIGYLTSEQECALGARAQEIGKLLNGLARSLKSSQQ
jgi:four helix bundle protein